MLAGFETMKAFGDPRIDRRRIPVGPRGEAGRRRRDGLARRRTARAVQGRPEELRVLRDHAGRHAGGDAVRGWSTVSRPNIHAIGDRPTAWCSTVTKRPSARSRGEGPANPHRARADPRRGGHPAFRQARRHRVDAGDPLHVGPARGRRAASAIARVSEGLYVWQKLLRAAPRSSTAPTRRSRTSIRSSNYYASVTRKSEQGAARRTASIPTRR